MSNLQKHICGETAENFGTIQETEDTVKPLHYEAILCYVLTYESLEKHFP